MRTLVVAAVFGRRFRALTLAAAAAGRRRGRRSDIVVGTATVVVVDGGSGSGGGGGAAAAAGAAGRGGSGGRGSAYTAAAVVVIGRRRRLVLRRRRRRRYRGRGRSGRRGRRLLLRLAHRRDRRFQHDWFGRDAFFDEMHFGQVMPVRAFRHERRVAERAFHDGIAGGRVVGRPAERQRGARGGSDGARGRRHGLCRTGAVRGRSVRRRGTTAGPVVMVVVMVVFRLVAQFLERGQRVTGDGAGAFAAATADAIAAAARR